MTEHVHYFKVLKDHSVFGLVHVNAVMKCDGMVDRLPCPARLTRMCMYAELEKKGDKHVTYFYREPAKVGIGG